MTTENNVAAQAGDEPIPCPFCGGAPQVDNEHDDRGNRVIECAGCGANVGANMLSAGWRRWNQRVSPRATADVERYSIDEICQASVKAGLGILECNSLIVTLKGA